jgi:hypothetical protein
VGSGAACGAAGESTPLARTRSLSRLRTWGREELLRHGTGSAVDGGHNVSAYRRGLSALDNAISESFVSTLKSEIGVRRYPTRQAARASGFEFIELFYNRVRRHSALGWRKRKPSAHLG